MFALSAVTGLAMASEQSGIGSDFLARWLVGSGAAALVLLPVAWLIGYGTRARPIAERRPEVAGQARAPFRRSSWT